MSTGIYKIGMLGREEVKQEHIDYWCELCQFPGRCDTAEDIQKCWDGSQSIAGMWHILHECPFLHKDEPCRCNGYQNIEQAFEAAGVEYRVKQNGQEG